MNLPLCRNRSHRPAWLPLRGTMLLAAVLYAATPAVLSAQQGPSLQMPDSSAADIVRERDRELNRNKEMEHRLERMREKERQKRIVDDANRLVELTALYRKSLEAHGTPNADDQKLLAQIEKLAREVKDRMRGM